MSKCFISYRHAKPDKDLVQYLEKFLQEHNHHVFVDKHMVVGTNWVKEIDKHIKSSDFFIVLLSEKSILSDMVRQEVKLAHELSQKRGKNLKILPIRMDFTGKLPFDLGAYLNSFQYGLWKQGDDFKTISEQLLTAMEQHESLPLKEEQGDDKTSAAKIQSLYNVTDAVGAPLPAADPRLPVDIVLDTGTVKLESPFYIKRKADEEMMKQFHIMGSTTIVKGSRQIGKSSLLARVHAAAQNLQQKSYYLDFQFLENSQLDSLDTLFKELAWELSENLNTLIKPDECWNKNRGAKRNLTGFIEKALLDNSQTRLLIIFDEVDRLFDYPFRDDFFSTVRYWHNLRASRGEYWNYLNLLIAHSTEPYLWIQDINQSPFNVGYHIKLGDFDFQQLEDLNTRHHTPLKTDKEIQELMELTGGQPYLARLAFYTLKTENLSIKELINIAIIEDSGPFVDHLRRFVWSLQKEKTLKDTLRKVLRGESCANEEHFIRLKAAGLVKGEMRHDVQMRCKLYSEYFRRHL